MKLAKKITPLFLTLLALLFAIPVGASAASSEDLTVVNGKITACNPSAEGSLVIPEIINGTTVTAIGKEAFKNCSGLLSVTIPDTVTIIDRNAFIGCTNIKSVKFNGTDVTLADRVFFECVSLTTVTLPSELKTIGDYDFSGCSSLNSIVLPDTLTTIGKNAFEGCAMQNVNIPASVTSIGENAFAGCGNVKAYSVDEANTSYKSDAAKALFNYEMTKLIYFPAASTKTDYTLPETVEEIGELAFSKNAEIQTVTASSSLKKIDAYAFSECSGLLSVTLNEGLEEIGNLAFNRCDQLYEITVPSTVTSYNSAFYASGIQKAVISQGVEVIDRGAFDTCKKLEEVTIPSSVTKIKQGAFANCESLTILTVPATVTEIDKTAFFGIKDNITLIVEAGSPTLTYARENSIKYTVPGSTKASIAIKNSTGAKTVNYGETLVMEAVVTNAGEGDLIKWTASDGTSSTEKEFSVSPVSGKVTVTVSVVDEDGNVKIDENGNEVSAKIEVSVNSGIFKKIISFFKNLFRMDRRVWL